MYTTIETEEENIGAISWYIKSYYKTDRAWHLDVTFSNQSKALKLIQQILEHEKEQKERDHIYDALKKRIELEKLGVSKERLDK